MIKTRPAGPSPAPILCWGGGGVAALVYLGNQKTWRKN